ncbi:MAG TPA: cytochrome P450 [Myxococcota bacterium]|nr:cytochrome P450 [Myxococcota bacterium]
MADRPELPLDLFSDAAIRAPHALYREIRDCAPAVWLPAHGAFAMGRHADVRAALRANELLISGRGVALNDVLNSQPSRTTLASDGALHLRRRRVLMRPMMPGPLADVRARLDELADALVARLVDRRTFEGIADFARHLPVAVVSRLVGLPEQGRERMLEWAAATFDALGPLNPRAEAALPKLLEMIQYAQRVGRTNLCADGWAARVFAAADHGAIDAEDVPGLLIDYIAPSLDTTILGAGHLLYSLGRHPNQYALVRERPELISSAVNEALRIGSPVRAFTRLAESDYDAEGVSIPKGARVLILYGSANRDERRYADPDRFDVTRDARDHVAFGHGAHRCAGAHLAQLELESLLRAMVARVRHIDVGEPEPLVSNVLHGFRAFPASFH